jgi:hypothetical protein
MAKITTALTIPDEIVMDKIYYIREHKVMLDNDLAELLFSSLRHPKNILQ